MVGSEHGLPLVPPAKLPDFSTMKDIVVSAMMIAIGITGLSNLDTIQRLYDEAYPPSAENSQALDRCAAANNRFDRLSAIDRGKCYAGLKAPSSPRQLQVQAR